MVNAKWTGSYPNLCSGTWILCVDGVDVSDKIPEDLRDSEMNTFGDYTQWHFTDGWREVWETYTNGLMEDEWIKENDYWLSTITSDYSVKSQIYYAISCEDWRHGSCGGCI